MNAKELRIGNLVFCYDDVEAVTDIVKDHGQYFIETNGYIATFLNNGEVKPIPLTEEWLERFGFEKQPEFMWLGNGADWQPEYPRTYHKDYYNGEFVFRFTDWQWMDKENKVQSDKSIEFLRTNESYYSKIMEGDIQFNSLEHVHQLQNLYFSLTGKELEYERD